MENGPEPRHGDRYDVQLDASMQSAEGSRQEVMVTNLSNTGCRFDAKRKLGLGAAIAIQAGRTEPVWARIRWRVGDAHGASFDEPLPDAVLDHLRMFLSETPALIAERTTA